MGDTIAEVLLVEDEVEVGILSLQMFLYSYVFRALPCSDFLQAEGTWTIFLQGQYTVLLPKLATRHGLSGNDYE